MRRTRLSFLVAVTASSLVGCGGTLAASVSSEAGADANPDAGGSYDASDQDGTTTQAPDGGADEGGDPSAATTYLLNPAHTSAIQDPTLAPPLAPSWTRDFGSSYKVNYPLVAGGDVYVLVSNELADANPALELIAIDETSGATVWGPVALDVIEPAGALAYDRGRVFVGYEAGTQCSVNAYDGATGQLAWTANLAGECALVNPPTAYRGIVYVNSGSLVALDEQTGGMLWSAPTEESFGAPAATDDGVFVSSELTCQYAFDRVTGAPLWQNPGCENDGIDPPVVSGNRDYVCDSVDGNVILDATSGALVGTFTAVDPPAVDGSVVVFNPRYSPLVAQSVTTGETLWTFAGDGQLIGPPVIAGGAVYTASQSGMLFAVDETSGAPLWSELYSPTMVPIFAAGQGRLLVWSESSSSVTAYARAPDAGAFPPGASTCTTPFGRCGTTCVDLQADPQNCGACGAPCTGTCANGMCTAPVVLAANEAPTNLALDATYVYWTNYSGGEIRRIVKSGAEPAVTINSAPNTNPLSIAVDVDNVYWTVPNFFLGGADAGVMQMPLDGGAAIALAANLAYPPEALAVSPTAVFWTSSGGSDLVLTTPIDGGATTSFAPGQGGAGAIAIDANNLYWSTDSATFQAPLGGGTPVSIGPAAAALAVDEAFVYFALSSATSSIVRVPIGGGTQGTLASARPPNVVSIAVDETRVYWVEAEGTIGMGAVTAIAKSGGAPLVLMSGLQDPSAIAVDDDFVYVANTAAGEIDKIAK